MSLIQTVSSMLTKTLFSDDLISLIEKKDARKRLDALLRDMVLITLLSGVKSCM